MELNGKLLREVIELHIEKARSLPDYPTKELAQEAVNLYNEMVFYKHDEGLTLKDDARIKGTDWAKMPDAGMRNADRAKCIMKLMLEKNNRDQSVEIK